MSTEQCCNSSCCFFCAMKQQDLSLRQAEIASCFKEMPLKDGQEHVLVLSSLWNMAMTQPDDPEFSSLGIFNCMASLIQKGINDKSWLLTDQNIYIPYYAAHIIGSYTMNKVEFAEKAVESGVIRPLMDLLRGKITWIEQRVAVRALGHLASYERTFSAVAEYEQELVELTVELASTCLDTVYANFVKDSDKRLKYHSELLTRGIGGIDMENRKAEEWASQTQCWSVYLLNCFACKERCLDLICKQEFLKDLCDMWGGLLNHSSPAGIGLIRILCYSKFGRMRIADCKEIINNLCNLSRSSDDWQYMGIDCLVLLLKDQETRYKVIEIATLFLVDIVELKRLGERTNVGEAITKALLLDYKQSNKLNIKNKNVLKILQEIRVLKVDRKRREKLMLSEEKAAEKRVLVGLIKQQAKKLFWHGDLEAALVKYDEALKTCPLRLRKDRMAIHSNKAQCHLLLGDADAAISESTRALSLSNPANSHRKSLWRRSQAYDIKGLAKESLMDCIVFVNLCINTKRVKLIPYYAARMISKQMEATWLFAGAKSKALSGVQEEDGNDEHSQKYEEIMMRIMMEKKGLSTIKEESFAGKEGSKRKVNMARKGRTAFVAESM
ncbi:uncharacterized protein LOC126678469 [Mercurialis annua]|uniref:uncharacterized protein LOC126678469 n=1 Tax=Mercurialis annua TaxID=3986 RepID=UPI00215E5102|nr:uncharacterized protein LOC126678469 [Mercurialis annua]